MTAANPYERKKEPERVRSALLASAMRLASEHGLAAVTIDAVAKAAGVTKGGLFHHFPSKDALIRGAFEEMIARIDETLDTAMAKDFHASGRFTRAYVDAILSEDERGYDNPHAALSLSMLADPSLQRSWAQWLSKRLEQQGEHDSDVRFAVVRLAADGAWLALLMTDPARSVDFSALREYLLALASPSPDS